MSMMMRAYADENTLLDTHHDIDILIENLERSAVKAIDWFEANQMLANPANFNYCPLVWHFCGQAETKKIEKLHHRALRFVFKSNESYCTLLKRANLCSLKNSRLRLIALEVYKILHKEAPRILHDLVELRQQSRYNLRGTDLLQIPRVKTTQYGIKSFRYAGTTIWNSLPESFRASTNFYQFKGLIKSWTGEECYCSVCTHAKWL